MLPDHLELTVCISACNVMLNNDVYGQNIPIAEARTSDVRFRLRAKGNKVMTRTEMTLESVYHNLRLMAWEPCMEPWRCSVTTSFPRKMKYISAASSNNEEMHSANNSESDYYSGQTSGRSTPNTTSSTNRSTASSFSSFSSSFSSNERDIMGNSSNLPSIAIDSDLTLNFNLTEPFLEHLVEVTKGWRLAATDTNTSETSGTTASTNGKLQN